MARGVARQATEWRYDVNGDGVVTRRRCERTDGWQGTGWMVVTEEAEAATGEWTEARRAFVGEGTFRRAWEFCRPEAGISWEVARRLVGRWSEDAKAKATATAKVGGGR